MQQQLTCTLSVTASMSSPHHLTKRMPSGVTYSLRGSVTPPTTMSKLSRVLAALTSTPCSGKPAQQANGQLSIPGGRCHCCSACAGCGGKMCVMAPRQKLCDADVERHKPAVKSWQARSRAVQQLNALGSCGPCSEIASSRSCAANNAAWRTAEDAADDGLGRGAAGREDQEVVHKPHDQRRLRRRRPTALHANIDSFASM